MNFGAVDTSGRSKNGRGIASQRSPAVKTNVRRERRFPRAGTCQPPQGPEVTRTAIGPHTGAVLRINKSGGIHRQFRRACRHPNRPKLCWVVDAGMIGGAS